MVRFDFLHDLRNAKAGDRIKYHTGCLMYDRLMSDWAYDVDMVATAAYEAMEAGMCELIQKKVGVGTFDYYAIKKSEPFKPIEWFNAYRNDRRSYRSGNVPIRAQRTKETV